MKTCKAVKNIVNLVGPKIHNKVPFLLYLPGKVDMREAVVKRLLCIQFLTRMMLFNALRCV